MCAKYVALGIGSSSRPDPKLAVKEAVSAALAQCGKQPTFAIVYSRSDADQQAILKAVNAHFKPDSWIGISTDKMFNSAGDWDPDLTVSIVCFSSDYLHFGVGVANNYRTNPHKAAHKATQQALENCKANKHLDAYVQFTRAKAKDYASIIRTPPYFILTYISGIQFKNKKAVPGNEAEFVSGILDYTGPHIPIFGGSASSSLEDYTKNVGRNYQFANGKLYTNAAIVVFVVSDLKFATWVEHGYDSTTDFAAVTKLDKKGYKILELNGNEPVAEYARLLGITKEKLLADPSQCSFNRPFGLVQIDGTTFIKEAMPNPDKKTLQSNFHLHKNSILNVLRYNKKKTLNTLNDVVARMSKQGPIALAQFCSCSGRRPLIEGIEKKEVNALRKKYPSLPFFGFYSFGEVGSTRSSSAQSHSQTITSLIIFDQLLTE